MKIYPLLLALMVYPVIANSQTLVDQLLGDYEKITSVSCDIRKDTENTEQKVRMLSRVHFQRPDRIHVENISPLARRIVADGTNLYYYVQDDPKGLSRPIDQLDEKMLMQVRKVPATAMDHLFRLQGVTETNLEGATEFPVRKGYSVTNHFVVLSLDATGRLSRIEFFATAEMQKKTAQYDFCNFSEVAPGVWLASLHQGKVWIADIETRETTHFDNLIVNDPIPASLFDASLFFKGVEFAPDFVEIYQ